MAQRGLHTQTQKQKAQQGDPVSRREELRTLPLFSSFPAFQSTRSRAVYLFYLFLCMMVKPIWSASQTLSLLMSYWNLLFALTNPPSISSPPSFQFRPICIITGCSYCSSPMSFITNLASWTYLVIAVDPGVVESNIMREVPPCLSSLAFKVLRFLYLLQSPEFGISSRLDAALASPETSGVYFFGGKGQTVNFGIHHLIYLWSHSLL